MPRLTASLIAALFSSAALFAQQPAPQQPAPVCAPNGYGAQGYYAMFAQNDDGFTAYEIASPCIGKEVRDVAESIGMGRGKVMTVKSVIGVQFRADGTMADGNGIRGDHGERHERHD